MRPSGTGGGRRVGALLHELGAPVLALVTIAAGLVAGAHAASAEVPDGPVSWLAAGDSYSSGEGIRGTGMDGDPRTCARSDLAYGPKAAGILTSQRGWVIGPLSFPACSGATLDEFYNPGAGQHEAQWQQALAAAPRGGRFDVVTLSFGGNDVGFADLLTGCMASWGKGLSWTGMVARGRSCDVDSADLEARIDGLVAGRSTVHPGVTYGEGTHLTLAGFYEQVVRENVSADGVLVVVGYPQLFADTGDWGDWRGRSCHLIDRGDADLLNAAGDRLDEALRTAVADANAALGDDRVRFVDRGDLFAGHELCSGSIEYLNGITVTERLMHSFHPNDIGHQITAEQVAGEVEAHLGSVAASPTTAPPTTAPPTTTVPTPSAAPRTSATPIDDGTSDFSIGDRFVSACVVAWPTAPTYTSDSIIMTMDCRAAPEQFTFTQVTLGDPELPITPGTGVVQVDGVIVDYAQSTYGFRTLVVEADSVTW
ncbi:SGNH/GDSL hydrolase family protein [Blastococcus atacamensis]|uniref:SGNH/GDSL hydrolase family protein n=1 Tax=Blastococcus atacamensis TaxID=2070508 RepID=UPI0012FFFE43|nr:SGNH/GDSL hydrolase family protein [Blastococcus atacamensis]